MLEVARDLLPRFLDRFGKGEAVRQARKAVAQHLRAERPLGLHLDRAIDDTEQAPRRRRIPARQRRQLQPEKLRRDSFALLEVELAGGIGPVEEAVDEVGNRALLEAVGFIPVERGTFRLVDGVDKAAVVHCDFELALVVPLDDRGGNRQCVEQGGVVGRGEVRNRV